MARETARDRALRALVERLDEHFIASERRLNDRMDRLNKGLDDVAQTAFPPRPTVPLFALRDGTGPFCPQCGLQVFYLHRVHDVHRVHRLDIAVGCGCGWRGLTSAATEDPREQERCKR